MTLGTTNEIVSPNHWAAEEQLAAKAAIWRFSRLC